MRQVGKMQAVARGLAGLVVLFCAASARADVGSVRRPVAFYSLGPTVELSLSGGWLFGAEAGLSQYVGSWGYGAAFGASTASRMYGELQGAGLWDPSTTWCWV